MKEILNVWFENERIYILANDDKIYSRPLEAFPILKQATDKERNNYKIHLKSKALRWDNIDEDIHINSFFETQEPQYNNEIARIFNQFDVLNVSAVARSININKSLLSKYIYGIKTPSKEREQEIKNALRQIGKELIAV